MDGCLRRCNHKTRRSLVSSSLAHQEKPYTIARAPPCLLSVRSANHALHNNWQACCAPLRSANHALHDNWQACCAPSSCHRCLPRGMRRFSRSAASSYRSYSSETSRLSQGSLLLPVSTRAATKMVRELVVYTVCCSLAAALLLFDVPCCCLVRAKPERTPRSMLSLRCASDHRRWCCWLLAVACLRRSTAKCRTFRIIHRDAQQPVCRAVVLCVWYIVADVARWPELIHPSSPLLHRCHLGLLTVCI